MLVAVIVDWYGPFEGLNDFTAAMGNSQEWPKGTRTFYLALGSHNKFRYIGLTENPAARFRDHPKIKDYGNKRFFAGEIVTQGISGRRRSPRSPDLAMAEHALISYFQPELNSHLLLKQLTDCVSIFSRFFDPNDYVTPRRPLPTKFPPVIAYNSWTGQFE